MPNYCYTNIYVLGDSAEIEKFYRQSFTANGDFDFEQIVPTPTIYNDTEASSPVDECIALLGRADTFDSMTRHFFRSEGLAPLDVRPAADIAKAHKGIDAFDHYGHRNWREWRNANWGTSDNAYDIRSNGPPKATDAAYEFTFVTSWSPPIHVLKALGPKYPRLRFEFAFAGELDYAGEGYSDGDESGCKFYDEDTEMYREVTKSVMGEDWLGEDEEGGVAA